MGNPTTFGGEHLDPGFAPYSIWQHLVNQSVAVHATKVPILWMDKILHQLRNPGLIRFPCKYQRARGSTTVSKWYDFWILSIHSISPFFGVVFTTFLAHDIGECPGRNSVVARPSADFISEVMPSNIQVGGNFFGKVLKRLGGRMA